jgi:hypothetical protein
MMKFDRITRLNIRSRSSLFSGYADGKKFFVKKYTIRKGSEREDLLKVRCEMLCYRNLGSALNLPKLVDADYRNRSITLDFVKFGGAPASRKTVDEVLDFQSRVMKGIDASFLPAVTYGYYSGTLRKLAAELDDDSIAKKSGSIIRMFNENRKAIEDSAKYFSHGDLRLDNIKYLDRKLTMIDLEHSRRDNLMSDLACLYVDLLDRKPLVEYLAGRIAGMREFDQRLFRLMLRRRCIEVLHALKDNRDSHAYKEAKGLLLKDLT